MVDICFPCLVVGLLLLFLIVSNFVGEWGRCGGVAEQLKHCGRCKIKRHFTKYIFAKSLQQQNGADCRRHIVLLFSIARIILYIQQWALQVPWGRGNRELRLNMQR